MSEYHLFQTCPCNPLETGSRIELRSVVRSEEPVALESSRRHENEDTKGGVAEPEAPWQWLAEHPDHRVYVL